MILLIACVVLSLFYGILINYYWYGWRTAPDFNYNGEALSIFISVIIPARNEEKNIGALLNSLESQTYPKTLYEVIVVDDNSSDRTVMIARQFAGISVLPVNETDNSFKKKAIETGIAAAKGSLIVCTDADCRVPPTWLTNISAFVQEKSSVFVAAPVVLEGNNSVLHLFQEMDFMMLQGITCASVNRKIHPMSNGANLAYKKEAFQAVNGFSGIDHIASGDDMLLMGRIQKKFPGSIHYLKSVNVIVSTLPQSTWKEFFDQRIRWASKARYYSHPLTTLILLGVYLYNLSFLVLLVAGFWNNTYFLWLMGALVLKMLVELPFFYDISVFFRRKHKLKYLFFLQPFHIAYVIVAGFLGQMGAYEWKGRRVK